MNKYRTKVRFSSFRDPYTGKVQFEIQPVQVEKKSSNTFFQKTFDKLNEINESYEKTKTRGLRKDQLLKDYYETNRKMNSIIRDLSDETLQAFYNEYA